VALLQFGRKEKNGKLVLDFVASNHAWLGMTPPMYQYFSDSLLKTLSQIDQKWSPELEKIWTHSLRSGLEYLSTQTMAMKATA
jgi:hypothetical protein